jgi:hypothetical protein
LKCSEPLKTRCSKRWAKPVRPGRSFFEPTWYQTFTATMGALWSSCTTSVSPFWSRKVVKGMSGISWASAPVAARASARASARRVGIGCVLSR